jgi:hypothetical protein
MQEFADHAIAVKVPNNEFYVADALLNVDSLQVKATIV